MSSPNGSKPSLYESLRHTSAAALLESLQSQLKQREGEIVQLQVRIPHWENKRKCLDSEPIFQNFYFFCLLSLFAAISRVTSDL